MTLEEAAALLAYIQVHDRRQVDHATVLAWHEALGDTTLAAAKGAVREHFRTSRDWLMPNHVLRLIRDAGGRILREAGPPDYPETFGDLPRGEQLRAEAAYRNTYHAVLLAGRTRDEAHRAADERLGVTRGELRNRPVRQLVFRKRP